MKDTRNQTNDVAYESHFSTSQEPYPPQPQFSTKSPKVDVIVLARDTETTNINQKVQCTTVPSPYTSHGSFGSQSVASGRTDEILPWKSNKQFPPTGVSNEIQNQIRPGPEFVYSPIEEGMQYQEKLMAQCYSDPYLHTSLERSSCQNLANFNPRDRHLNSIALSRRRVRLAIPISGESNDYHIEQDSPKRSIYDGSNNGSSFLKVNADEEGDVDIRRQEISPRLRPSGFEERLLRQVPETSVRTQLLMTNPNLLRPPTLQSQTIIHDEDQFDSEEDNNKMLPSKEDKLTPSNIIGNSSTGNTNYFKRRRTAVFGLSPTSGLNIGAVM